MGLFEAVILGLVQGLTEFIPVSSSGHLILVREFFSIEGGSLAFDAVLQLATVLAVAVYFLKDAPNILRDKKLLLAIIVGTIPALIFGLLFEDKMETAFRSSELVAWTLILGALLMYVAEKFGSQNSGLTPTKGLIVGFFQSLALVPGMSRSGSTISGGLLTGLNREMATRFSFLLSVPIIAGSGLKKLFDLSSAGGLVELGLPLLVASVVAFLSGLWAVSFLVKYLKSHKLTPFIWYRVALAVVIFVLF